MTSNSPSRKRAPKRPMIADLVGYPTAAAVEVAATVLDEDGAYPGAVEAAAKALTKVGDWAVAHGVDRLSALTGDRAAQMLLDLTGASSLAPMDPVQRDALHLYRNTITMLRLMVLLTRPTAVTRRSDRPAKDAIDAGLPEIGPRTGYGLRALRDDEIILARLLVALDVAENAPLVPVHNYVLSDAGLAPMAITDAATARLIWDHQRPVKIKAKGVHKRPTRTVHFDAWHQHTLSTTVPAYQRSGRPYLAYTGAKPGTQEACASTSPTLGRFLRRAGITGPDVSGSSVALWRADHILRSEGDLTAAAYAIGSAPGLVVKNLHYAIDELDIHRGLATLITLDARPDVQVPAGQVQGLVGWADDEDNPGTLRPVA